MYCPVRSYFTIAVLLFTASLPAGGAAVSVSVNRGGVILIRTQTAEFDISPDGYCTAFLTKNGRRFTLDDPEAGASGDHIRIDGKENKFVLDHGRVQVDDTGGGKRIQVRARPEASDAAIERTTVYEIYEDFPGTLLSRVTYKNTGAKAVALDHAGTVEHRLSAKLSDPEARPYQLWSFHGASAKW